MLIFTSIKHTLLIGFNALNFINSQYICQKNVLLLSSQLLTLQRCRRILAFAILEKTSERGEDLFDDKKVEQARASDRLFSFIYSLFFGVLNSSFGAGFSFGAEPNTTGAEIYLNSPFPSMLRPCAHLPSLLSSPLEKLNRS